MSVSKRPRRLTTERSRQAQSDRKTKHDAKLSKSSFKIGDYVKWRVPENHPIRNKLSSFFVAPCEVIEKLGEETNQLKKLYFETKEIKREITAHSTALFPYFLRKEDQFVFKNDLKNNNNEENIEKVDKSDQNIDLNEKIAKSENRIIRDVICERPPRVSHSMFSLHPVPNYNNIDIRHKIGKTEFSPQTCLTWFIAHHRLIFTFVNKPFSRSIRIKSKIWPKNSCTTALSTPLDPLDFSDDTDEPATTPEDIDEEERRQVATEVEESERFVENDEEIERERVARDFERLSSQDAKTWKRSLQLYVRFLTGHFGIGITGGPDHSDDYSDEFYVAALYPTNRDGTEEDRDGIDRNLMASELRFHSAEYRTHHVYFRFVDEDSMIAF